MRHLTRADLAARRLLRGARAVAVIEPVARRGHPSAAVVEYLKEAGFDVFPVRGDQAEVCRLRSYAKLADIPGGIDLVLVFRDVDPALIEVAARKGAQAVWLPRGVVVRDAARRAARAGLALFRDRDIVEDHRHGEQAPGEPRKLAPGPR